MEKLGLRDWLENANKYIQKTENAQQMTALHMIASSRNVLEMSFSKAYVKLLPSINDD